MHRLLFVFAVIFCCALPARADKAPSRDPDQVIRIWETGGWSGTLPGGWKIEGPETSVQQAHMGGTTAIGNVSVPLLEYFAPEKSKAGSKCVIVCPGGGYHILAWDLEGREIAAWLSSRGIHAFVLKYRLPRKEDAVRHAPALQDAQRAVSLIRKKAADFGIAADQIGMLGFSAGGHLAATTSVSWRNRSYDAADEIDHTSCRPDFTVLIYTAYLVKEGTVDVMENFRIDRETPPALLIHAADDGIPMQNSMGWALALKKAGVAAELHIYPDGGHGYGLRSDRSVRLWPQRVEEWLARQP